MIEFFLKKNLTRLQILRNKIKSDELKKVYISVYRNHSFEHMEGLINSFLSVTNLLAEFTYSEYDDSFNFQTLSDKNDLNIIWVDFSRYNNINIKNWISDRISNLRKISSKPILVYYIGFGDLEIDGAICKGSQDIEKILGDDFYDDEKYEYSGTHLSSKAEIKIAQELGLRYLPSFFITPIKAIIIDLDNTFYKGILGEDGIENIVPNYKFQNQLKILKEQGVMLSIASKNEYRDVKEMFRMRKDFVLKWEDFSSHNISWETKDKAVLNTVKQFNIGLDSILFIDDNIGEINRIKLLFPSIKTLLADENLSDKLSLYPLLERYYISAEDNLRIKDIDANKKRYELAKSMDECEYFKQLAMKLSYSIDKIENLERAIQLLNKTNQFIFSFKRYKKEDLDVDQHVLTISLKDKLSDSGIIGVIVARNKNQKLKIDELVVSCRALGRNIEENMINSAFSYLSKQMNTSNHLLIDFRIGERNNPARSWLENYTGTIINKSGEIQAKIKENCINTYITEDYC